MAKARNQRRNFAGWKLASFTRFRTLRHFDLKFIGPREVFRSNAKSRGSNLLYAIASFRFIAIDVRILAAFTRVAARP